MIVYTFKGECNMNTRGRSQLALGVILILLGAWFLLDRSIPAFHAMFSQYTEWPSSMFLAGGVIFILGLVLGQPSLAIPAAIIAGLAGFFIIRKLPGSPGPGLICGR